ncbi:MAG TPA: hypothetical protein D7H94_01955 [Candidatus Poseidoniales archaeon]|nr:MAG TPA: hypothetical protein D7H94_01955 [Candidatus Poseidoniales archaeon]|tara:strand:+ start:435 stop:701 length:267 start_codon:yes stop_codon:yes gene_type:complete
MTSSTIAFSNLEPVTSVASFLGMLCILFAFVLETRGYLNSRGLKYLSLMAVGSAILGIRALHTGEWAFVILELVWMIAALLAIISPNQ